MPESAAYSYNGERIFPIFPSRYHSPPLCLLIDIQIELYQLRRNSLKELIQYYLPEEEEEFDEMYANAFSFTSSGKIFGLFCDQYCSYPDSMLSFIQFLTNVKQTLILQNINYTSGKPTISNANRSCHRYVSPIELYVGSQVTFSNSFDIPFLFAALCSGLTQSERIAYETNMFFYRPLFGTSPSCSLIFKDCRGIMIPRDLDYHLYEAVYASSIQNTMYVDDEQLELIVHAEIEQSRREKDLTRVKLESYMPIKWQKPIKGACLSGSGSNIIFNIPHWSNIIFKRPSGKSHILTLTSCVYHKCGEHEMLMSLPSCFFHSQGGSAIVNRKWNLSYPCCYHCPRDNARLNPVKYFDFITAHGLHGKHIQGSMLGLSKEFKEKHENFSKVALQSFSPTINPEILDSLKTIRSWYLLEDENLERFNQSLIAQGIELYSDVYGEMLAKTYTPFSFVSGFQLYAMMVTDGAALKRPSLENELLVSVKNAGYSWSHISNINFSFTYAIYSTFLPIIYSKMSSDLSTLAYCLDYLTVDLFRYCFRSFVCNNTRFSTEIIFPYSSLFASDDKEIQCLMKRMLYISSNFIGGLTIPIQCLPFIRDSVSQFRALLSIDSRDFNSTPSDLVDIALLSIDSRDFNSTPSDLVDMFRVFAQIPTMNQMYFHNVLILDGAENWIKSRYSLLGIDDSVSDRESCVLPVLSDELLSEPSDKLALPIYANESGHLFSKEGKYHLPTKKPFHSQVPMWNLCVHKDSPFENLEEFRLWDIHPVNIRSFINLLLILQQILIDAKKIKMLLVSKFPRGISVESLQRIDWNFVGNSPSLG
ncbi:hypothetical protein ADUPG1_011048 [Aduncisulcus paluster]|uniref:Uncharacterized protein n=1 Tax=Aduncisulcus paluster TaxID=2918883 RepID=A0ABQ5JYG8_9EUKA|nr:hypothetical protein ADUPG1_011048 [Aduncisulcus paluster]